MKLEVNNLSFALMLSLLAAPALSMAQPAPATKSKATAASAGDAKHRKEDIAKHRQIARAHDEAAKCLEGSEKESVCHSRLQQACKGIAVGKYCGMRHAH